MWTKTEIWRSTSIIYRLYTRLSNMGYDASVYVIYGIPFDYNPKTGDSLDWLLDLMVPDLVKEYGYEDTWSCFDTKPHTDGYYLLNFTNDGKLYLASWFVAHEVCRDRRGPQLLDMPSERSKTKFLNWCVKHNIDMADAGFYTVIGD